MAWTRKTRNIGLAAAIAALTGCQGLVPGTPRAYVPTFRVEALADAPGQAGATPVQAPAIPVEAQGVTPEAAGQLVVSFGHVLPKAAQRRLLATVADVEKVTITLSGNGVNHTETILKAAITNGQTTFTFTGLPAGQLTVTIKALNATGATIGQDVQTATVTAGQTTTVTSTVALAPAVANPRVIVSAGGSGGSGGNSGTLTTNVALRDDIPVITPPLVGVHAPTTTTDPIWEPIAYNVVLDDQGNGWFTGEFSRAQAPYRLAKVTPAGALSYVDAPAGLDWWFLGVNHDRTKILLPNAMNSMSPTTAYGVTTAGAALTAAGALGDPLRLAQAADGSLYIVDGGFDPVASTSRDLTRLAPDGTRTTLYDAGDHGAAIDVVVDHAGDPIAHVFVDLDPADGLPPTREIRKYQPDGTMVFSRTYTSDVEHVVDSQNNVWVVDTHRASLEKLSPSGQLLGTFPTPARCNKLYVDPLDRVWAYQSGKMFFDHFEWNPSGGPDDVVSRFDSDGTLRAYYHVGLDADTEHLAVSADDHMWVASKAKGLIHLKLDPLP